MFDAFLEARHAVGDENLVREDRKEVFYDRNLLSQAKEIIEGLDYPLPVDDQDWARFPYASCYTYALGLPFGKPFLIGDFIGDRMTHHNTIKEIVYTFKAEMEELGFWVEDAEVCEETDPMSGAFKLFLNFDNRNNYHLIRQNEDGSWTRKTVGELPTMMHLGGRSFSHPDDWSRIMKGEGFCFMAYKP